MKYEELEQTNIFQSMKTRDAVSGGERKMFAIILTWTLVMGVKLKPWNAIIF